MKKQAVPKTSPTPNPVIDWSFLLNSLPLIIFRHRWDEYAERLGLPYARGTLQNFDSVGTGPAKVMFGNRVAYRKEAVIAWLNSIGTQAAGGSQSTARR